jgi:hypothetical protein
MYGEVEVKLCAISDSALRGKERSASSPVHLMPSYKWTEGMVGPTAGKDKMEKKKKTLTSTRD